MLRDTHTAFSLPVNQARHDTDLHWARMCWVVMGQWLQPQGIPHGTRDPALVGMRGTSYQNMKYQSSLHRCVVTGGSEKAARVSQRMNYLIGVIEFYISANVTWIMSCMWVYMLFVGRIEIED